MKLPDRLNTGNSSARSTNPFRGMETRLAYSPPAPLASWNAPGRSGSRVPPPSEIEDNRRVAEMLQADSVEEATRRLIMQMVHEEVRGSFGRRATSLLNHVLLTEKTQAAEDASYARRLQGGDERHSHLFQTETPAETSPAWDSMLDLLAAGGLCPGASNQ